MVAISFRSRLLWSFRTPTMSSPSNDGDPNTPPSPQQLYNELTHFFNARPGHLLEIEVLPAGFPLQYGTSSPILQDGPNLGIPKKALVQAFLVARNTLFGALELTRPNDREAAEAMAATQVILLFDPEHLTAANYRKRRLLHLRASRSSLTSESHFFIQNELMYLESLLTSPLHRHTKSPTLWHHRRWLVKEFLDQICQVYSSSGGDSAGSREAFELLWRTELEVVERSGARHPKNYYAWSYVRWILGFIAERDLSKPPEDSTWFLAECSAWRIHDWCLAHPTDISGWSFLVCLLQMMRHKPKCQREIFKSVWEFTSKFSWEGEAVWWFLRAVLTMEGIMPVGTRRQYFQSMLEGVQERSKVQALESNTDHTSSNYAVQAVRFCAKFRQLEGVPVDAG